MAVHRALRVDDDRQMGAVRGRRGAKFVLARVAGVCADEVVEALGFPHRLGGEADGAQFFVFCAGLAAFGETDGAAAARMLVEGAAGRAGAITNNGDNEPPRF